MFSILLSNIDLIKNTNSFSNRKIQPSFFLNRSIKLKQKIAEVTMSMWYNIAIPMLWNDSKKAKEVYIRYINTIRKLSEEDQEVLTQYTKACTSNDNPFIKWRSNT